jgi:V/A-type H+-transporting ATPase subunit D
VAIKFHYNKTSLQTLQKDLKLREKILPTIKNKESALRLEVKKAKDIVSDLNKQIEEKYEFYNSISSIWSEFETDIVRIEDVKLSVKKIAGVKVPILEDIVFEIKPINLVNKPGWFMQGVKIIKELANLGIKQEVFNTKANLLERARKKTTQKVNLYEKVQIPGYNEAIMKIKRFMEDEENLSKSSQKIVKMRHQQVQL